MSSASGPDIAASLAAVRARVAAAARSAGRAEKDVTLVAVSKTHGVPAITAAIAAGQRVFGENRVQEAEAKYRDLRSVQTDLTLHLIGPLQTNKVRDAVAFFDVIETVDRLRLAEALRREMDHQHRDPVLFIQVNTGEEPQKAGISPGEADAFIEHCRDALRLEISGLMCIPPEDEEPALHFTLLRDIARKHGITGLSMGMSHDFETAIRFGATHVRVGTAIFGPRPSGPEPGQLGVVPKG